MHKGPDGLLIIMTVLWQIGSHLNIQWVSTQFTHDCIKATLVMDPLGSHLR